MALFETAAKQAAQPVPAATLTSTRRPLVQRKCGCSPGAEECKGCQAKLAVSQPNDPLEHEADAVADRVMRMADPAAATPAHHSPLIYDDYDDDRHTVMPKRDGAARPAAGSAAPTAFARAGGHGLDAGARRFLEPRMGLDFSAVRVHTDAGADRSARRLGALAFTVGRDVYFAAGRYQPATEPGRRLLAHELAHVAQQGSGAVGAPQLIQRKAAPPPRRRTAPPRVAVPARRTGALVENGRTAGPGQMQRAQFFATLQAALVHGCEVEMAPFGRSARDCPIILRSIAHYARLPLPYVMRVVERFGHVAPGSNAHALIDAVVRRGREIARRLAVTPHAGDRPRVHGMAEGPHGLAPHDPAAVRAQLGGGEALDAGVRQRMERATGGDFGDVRVHTDGAAARLSHGLSARAFTVGRQIAFGAAQYRPGTASGDRLIAHELAHTMQQRGRDERLVQRAPLVLAGLFTTAEVATDVVIVDGVVTVAGAAAVEGTGVVVAGTAGTELVAAGTPALVTAAAPTAATLTSTAATSSTLSTLATATGVGVAATTLSGDSTTDERRDDDNQCRQMFPEALTCSYPPVGVYEAAIEFLMNEGYGFDDIGTCRGVSTFAAGNIDACDGAPGESWHCGVKDSTAEVSVFGCLCCQADGGSSLEWRAPHWSVNLTRRGG